MCGFRSTVPILWPHIFSVRLWTGVPYTFHLSVDNPCKTSLVCSISRLFVSVQTWELIVSHLHYKSNTKLLPVYYWHSWRPLSMLKFKKALGTVCDWGKSTLISTKAAVVSNHFNLKWSIVSQNAVKEFDSFELESQMNVSLQCDWLKDLLHLTEECCVKRLNVSHSWIWKAT